MARKKMQQKGGVIDGKAVLKALLIVPKFLADVVKECYEGCYDDLSNSGSDWSQNSVHGRVQSITRTPVEFFHMGTNETPRPQQAAPPPQTYMMISHTRFNAFMTSLQQSLKIDDLDKTFAKSVLEAYNIHVKNEATAIHNSNARQAITRVTTDTHIAFDTYLKGQSMVVVEQPGQTTDDNGGLAIAYVIGPGNNIEALNENFKTWLLSKLDGVAAPNLSMLTAKVELQRTTSHSTSTLSTPRHSNTGNNQVLTHSLTFQNQLFQRQATNASKIVKNGTTTYNNMLYEVFQSTITVEGESFPVFLAATPRGQSGSGREKVKVLGRVRNVIKEGRRKFVMVKGVKMSLTEAKRLSRAAATRK